MTSSYVRSLSKVSKLGIDTFSSINKETEDFKKALAEAMQSPQPQNQQPATEEDPVFDLIIRLLKESKNPAAGDILNYHYISCGATPDALDYFYQKSKTGDAVARVQLGKLSREGKLTGAIPEVQVVAEAFASQHELAMLKLESESEEKSMTVLETTGSEVFDGAINILNDEEKMEDVKERAKKYEEHRAQPFPVERIEDPAVVPTPQDEAAFHESIRNSLQTAHEKIQERKEKAIERAEKIATKQKKNRSKKNPSKAKKKGVVNG